MRSTVFFLFLAGAVCISSAIECKFRYEEETFQNGSDKNDLESPAVPLINPKKPKHFDCDDENDGDMMLVKDENEEDVIVQRGGTDDDDVKRTADRGCECQSQVITPSFMTGLNNELLPVHQDKNDLQTIQIFQCLHGPAWKDLQACDMQGMVVPEDEKFMCKTEFSEILLTTINEEKEPFHEYFYYPSGCRCRHYKKKSST